MYGVDLVSWGLYRFRVCIFVVFCFVSLDFLNYFRF